MHPELFTVPILDISVKTYGFFLTVGFLSAVWFAMRRAQRVGANPDRVLDASFLSLVFGVGGARLFYVMHYWQTDFAFRQNKLLAAIDIREGGLEFLGGVIGAVVAVCGYLWMKKLSIRLYLDILAPATMWGLGFGRLGCFFNGCCFGGLCLIPGQDVPQYQWAVQFPYGSPAHVRQWEDRRLSVPAELISSSIAGSSLLPASILNLPIEKREEPRLEVRRLEDALAKAKLRDPDGEDTRKLADQLKQAHAKLRMVRQALQLAQLDLAQRFPSRLHPERGSSVTELQQIAQMSHSLPVHPTQLYSSIHAFILSGLLASIFYIRKRHGLVILLMFIMYPVARIPLELIRVDNPPDILGFLTISQFVSLMMSTIGLLLVLYLYKALPEQSPLVAREIKEMAIAAAEQEALEKSEQQDG